jgi:pimeloyl-ACP methyl ester carboxylesterase
MDALLWAASRKALAASGYHVVTPDLPGFGGSARSDAEPSLDVYADEVARLMDHLMCPRAVIGGLSMGGYVAMAMLRRYPERVAGLVLADTKADADSEAAAANRLAMADAVLAAKGQQEVVEGMLAGLLGATTHASRPQVVSTVRRWVLGQDPRAVAWAQRAMATRPDSHADLQAFSGPALVVVGEEDTLSPLPAAQSMFAALGQGAKLGTIPAVGHLSAVENPSAVAGAIGSWLGRSENARR